MSPMARERTLGARTIVSISSQAPVDLVSAWVAAFNEHDLDGMLVRLDRSVDFRPLKLSGLARSYRGHDGVRRWFEQSRKLSHDYQLDIEHISPQADGSVFTVAGWLRLGQEALSPFTAIHTIAGGQIRSAHHYLSELDLIARLGLRAVSSQICWNCACSGFGVNGGVNESKGDPMWTALPHRDEIEPQGGVDAHGVEEATAAAEMLPSVSLRSPGRCGGGTTQARRNRRDPGGERRVIDRAAVIEHLGIGRWRTSTGSGRGAGRRTRPGHECIPCGVAHRR